MGAIPFYNQRPVWKSNTIPSWGCTASDKADWMTVLPSAKETHIVCQSPLHPILLFPPLWGECLSVPQFHGYGWSEHDAVKVVPPRGAWALLISAESFSREQAFSKHKHRTWWMWCQQRASNRSIWPSQINLRFYDLEQYSGPAPTQQVKDSGLNCFKN